MTVHFIGAGPGAADLITLRGARVIAAADIVIWARSLVHEDVLADVKPGAVIVDSALVPLEGILPHYQRAHVKAALLDAFGDTILPSGATFTTATAGPRSARNWLSRISWLSIVFPAVDAPCRARESRPSR